jgi:hypothetical protein
MRCVKASAAAGLIIVAVVLLSGCGGGSSTSGGTASSVGAPAAAPGAAQGRAALPHSKAGPAGGVGSANGASSANSANSASSANGAGSTGQMLAAGADVVYTASMAVDVRDVSQAAMRAAALASQAGGYVSAEHADFRPPKGGRASAVIQLKLPVSRYPGTLRLLAGLGTQASLSQQADDVTAQVADTASRVASDQAAITQLRTFLARAGSIGALLTVQGQINRQESALEAMQAQQRALNHETAYATVTLTLTGPKPHPAHHARRVRHRAAGGFVAGITAGWKALVVVVAGLLTVLGAVLPIAVACALADYLGYRLLRGRRWVSRPGKTPRAPGQ